MKKLKTKNLVILFIIFLCIFFMIHITTKTNKDPNKNDVVSMSKEPYKNISYYNKEYQQRYEKYKTENPDLSLKNIVTRVNIGLDHSFYTHTKKTPFLNKDYILVNKYLYLDKQYVPANLESISTQYSRSGMKLVHSAREAFENMAKAALDDHIQIIAMSSYRGYDYQVNLYNRYVASDGVEAADTYSARPGFSEHQTGLCVDIYDGVIDYTDFEKSKSFHWMEKNAHKYGFILRYPKGKEHITGYQYESWHYRYVGEEIASYIYKSHITFDEYYVRNFENQH
ncbi:MAG: M15 family metallopeptidase [Bacilli bacterium]|nr:M15 family metallopeptidase [Bacilli bacterium]